MRSLKAGRHVELDRGLFYLVGADGKRRREKPWLGDLFSFLYDRIMERSVFPKKSGADGELHRRIVAEALKDVHGKETLELATGSGFGDLELYVVPAEDLPLASDSFDLGICMLSLDFF